MIIPLDDTWFLDCDDRSVALTERRIITGENSRGKAPKAENIGKEREVQHGFYGSIADACKGYLNKHVAGAEGQMTAAQIITAWTSLTARVETVCKTIPKRGAEALPVVEAVESPKAPAVAFNLPQA